MPLKLPLPPATGISYGPVNFDSGTETTAFDFKTAYSEDGRVVGHVEVGITLKGYVTTNTSDPNDTTDTQMNTLRQVLQRPGLVFRYPNGAGSFQVNTAVFSRRDVDFGPNPTLLRVEPIGSKAAKITWSVLLRFPECGPGFTAAFQGAVKEFNYRVAWSVQNGLTRRTITGFLTIPNNMGPLGGRVTADCADLYREQISLPVPQGTRRHQAPQGYTLSPNRSRLDFSFVDESLPSANVPPPGVYTTKTLPGFEFDCAAVFRAARAVRG